MKTSNRPTEFLMIKAMTDSEWDSCDFVIVEATKSWQRIMRKRLRMLLDFKNDAYFFRHVYWDSPLGFFIHDREQEDDISAFLANHETEWCFIELSTGELDSLKVPENRLEARQVSITASGWMHFKAYGKHTADSFWTKSINLPAVLTKLKT